MTATCPEVHELQRLLHGELAPEPSDACLGHVERCPACAEAVEGLFAADPVIAAVRCAPQDTPAPAPVLNLIRRLSALRASATTSLQDATPAPGVAAPEEVVAALAPAQAPDELGRLGGYRVLRKLGAGGMGVVFLAEDVALRRQVALKVMRPALAHHDSARKRFLREARAVAAVEHENIVAVHQVGEERGVPYFAMPLLRGASLEERLRTGGALPLADVVRLGRQIALGLAAAHERGLVHRDVKPGNIWIEPDGGRAKLLDFGLARELVPGRAAEDEPLTELGTIIGTPAYLAPEQARGQAVDGRADLFSLGCVLYRMTTGRQPFAGDDPVSLIVSIATDTPPAPASLNPSLPRPLSELIMQLLEKNPKKRPASAVEVARRLAILERPAPAARGRRAWWTVAAAALLLAVVGIVAAEIVIRIKDKSGKTVAEVKVPEGGSVETVERKEGTPPAEESEAPPAPVTLMDYGAEVGEKLTFSVTGAVTGGTVWGTGPYTLDSDLAMAAVHAGAVKAGKTGLVTFTIVKPPRSFDGSTANGVRSQSWDEFPAGAFTVARGGGGTVRRGKLSWARTIVDAEQLSSRHWPEGTVLTTRVKGSTSGTVWGSGPYTLDSDLATAAVHAGVLKEGETGNVTIRLMASPDKYTGSKAHGVTTRDYGRWPEGAFVFVEKDAEPADAAEALTGWVWGQIAQQKGLADPGSLSAYGDRKGKRLTFRVTGDRSGTVWGSGPYTLDSSLAAAAVHAGVIKPGETGTVTVEVIDSPKSYTGSAANGVTSLAFGEWPAGAFQFVK
jgi:tRNA A-37 threonylcarbamoyl transferase component Bud32